MDCLQAREIVSEAFDRGVAATPGVEEARAHCRECAECRAFVEGLVALQKAPQPQAPAALVDGILERAALMAEHADEMPKPRLVESAPPEEPAPAEGPADAGGEDASVPPAPVAWEPDIASPAPQRPRPKWWWVPRASAIAGAAAVVVFAVVVSVQGFRALSGGGAESVATRSAAPAHEGYAARDGATAGAVPPTWNGAQDSSAAAAQKRLDSEAGGAAYVAFEGHAWVSLGERSIDRSTLSVAGTLSSSLGTTATPAPREVWRSSAYRDLIFLEPNPGGFVAFRSVERSLAGKPFVLSTESGVTGFGQWPALPSRFATPTASDGRPTFASAGKDDTGLQVFAPIGASAEQGFAVAPGTSASDPAGGNPHWTWWVPRR